MPPIAFSLLLLHILICINVSTSATIKTFGILGKKLLTQKIENLELEKCEEPESIILSGGCFWSIELAFQRIPGVISTNVGYCGGVLKNPTYRQVSQGNTNHAESVKITFNSKIIQLSDLLDWFMLELHDPTIKNRAGNDIGSQYRSAIFALSSEQQLEAVKAVERFESSRSTKAITEIVLLNDTIQFYPAEEYHQRYLEKLGQSSKKSDPTPIRCYG